MSELLVSTRDTAQQTQSYSDSLLTGLGINGGLFVPIDGYPNLKPNDLGRLKSLRFTGQFTEIVKRFAGQSLSLETIEDVADQAYSLENFPSVHDGNVAPVSHIVDNHYLLKLYEGYTGAFKDFGLQALAKQVEYILTLRNQRLMSLGATSGDTGSAAEKAVKGLSHQSLVMLSPRDGMEVFQRAQMGVQTGDNIYNISLPVSFTPCQDMVKEIAMDPEFADLGAVNSINWGRIVAQVPYYISGYLQTIEQAGLAVGDPIDVVVPSGNFGNMFAAYIAREMGIPIRRLIVATNENNVIDELIQTGMYKHKDSTPTSSPSMDISKASNLERLFYDIMEGDAEKLTSFMRAFEKDGQVSFSDFGISPGIMRDMNFDSGVSTSSDRIDSIRWVYNKSVIIIDPHTADAITVARRSGSDKNVPILSVATADPVKFDRTIHAALGFVSHRAPRYVNLERKTAQMLGGGFVELPYNVEAVKTYLREVRAGMPA